MQQLDRRRKACLQQLLSELINQGQAQIVVPAYQPQTGFWFGGGKLTQDSHGTIWTSGRYRNYGDSRTGVEAGQRGLECAIFRSDDRGRTFSKVRSWSKADLSYAERKVLSFEGSALHQHSDGSWELFISSEKDIAYPDAFAHYQKPGTGVWTIDCISGPSPDELTLSGLKTVLENREFPGYLHVKDPAVFDMANGSTALLFSDHPISWTSGNTGLAVRASGESAFQVQSWELVARGPSWDIAVTRLTDRMSIPRVGCFADMPACSIYLYDGAECVRQHEQNPRAHKRPRGYSCEEIGGALFGWDHDFPHMERLSLLEPLFVSSKGSGCSRYVATLVMESGILATWQQSQEDLSQPLVAHFLPMDDVRQILKDA